MEGSQTTAGGLTNIQNQHSSPRSQTTAEILRNEKNDVEVTSKGLAARDMATHSMVDSCDEMAALKVLSSSHERDAVDNDRFMMFNSEEMSNPASKVVASWSVDTASKVMSCCHESSASNVMSGMGGVDNVLFNIDPATPTNKVLPELWCGSS